MKIVGQAKINKGFEIEKESVSKDPKRKQGESWLNPILYNVGIYLMTPILLGVLVGYSLDGWLKTRPFFTIFFIILGTLSSFYNFWKIAKK